MNLAAFGPDVIPAFQFDVKSAHNVLENISFAFQLSTMDLQVTSNYTSQHSGVQHVYLQQIFQGKRILNAVANLNILSQQLISMGSTLVPGNKLDHWEKRTWTPISPQKALEFFLSKIDIYLGTANTVHVLELGPNRYSLRNLNFVPSGQIEAELGWINTDTLGLRPCWNLNMDFDTDWFQAAIDAEGGEIHSLLNWVSHASYAVFPLGAMNPKKGKRKLMQDSLLKTASPLGWHSDGTMNYTTTQGNNVIAQENLEGSYKWKNNHRPSSNRLFFEFPIDFSKYPDQYVDASITNLFYWNNALHDLFYAYGFTEEAGNFQQCNFGKGGKDNDAVIANAQDGSGFNNAYFATPPDGQHGRMKMFVWDSSEPWRDGDLEAAIITHEYSHGVSNRLTGGPDNVGCLGWGESGGMGEGWGDFLGILLQMDAHTKPTDAFGMAEYSNAGKTIRKFMYSTNMKVNPLTYASVREKRFFGSHAMGEIWAEILFEVYWNFVPKFGFDSDWFNLPSSNFLSRGPPGNIVMMQLIIDGMKLQPCFPSFVDGRDAIIQADIILYGGIHECDLWKGFAKRGLGIGAKKGGFESFQVPFHCH